MGARDDAKRLIEVSGILEKVGFRPVVTLADNRKVLQFLKENQVATIVLDIEMESAVDNTRSNYSMFGYGF